MSQLSASTSAGVAEGPALAPTRKFVAWPLWAAVAGIAGTIGTVVTDLRPDAEVEAWEAGEEYTVTSADMSSLEPLLGRIGHVSGLLAIVGLIVFAAAWRRHVEQRHTGSTAARVVSAGLLVTAGGLTLGYGWRGSLANYLGNEAGTYDSEGLFVYYMLTDFGAYLPWFATLISLAALTWMAWAERTVSRILGTLVGLVAVGLAAAVVITGIPGLPGTLGPLALALAGVWLAVGRSRVTRPDVLR